MIGRLLALSAFVFLAACGPQERTPVRYEEGFMRGCLATASSSLCTCAWQRVVAEVPVDQFEEYELLTTDAERLAHPLTAKITEIRASCGASELPAIPAPSPTESAPANGARVEQTP